MKFFFPTGGTTLRVNVPAVMLAVVAPLVVGLLLYVATGAQVAAHPVPFLAC